MIQTKLIILAALVASASAFAPAPAFTRTTTHLFQEEKADWEKAVELGWSMGGEDYSRNPEVKPHEDPRKSITPAPSFEEYMKARAAEQGK
jgi:hypothetical protein